MLDLDEEEWCNVRRIQWRLGNPDEALPEQIKGRRLDSHITASEVVQKHDEDIITMSGIDIDWIKGYYASLYPAKIVRDEVFQEVEEALREVGGKVDLGWPMAIVMATRR